MDSIPYRNALVVGTGTGISGAFVRRLRAEGLEVAMAARDAGKLAALADETGAISFSADATDPSAVVGLFDDVEARIGAPEVVLYNASGRIRGPIVELDPQELRRAIDASAYGAFLVVQQAAKRMLPRGAGAILLTGATASVKGFANSAGFAMGKFALRGLAQSAARELAPQGIHVAHFVIDGIVRSAARHDPPEAPDSTLDPDAIAEAYISILRQPRSAWTWEVELRPWTERF